jgi:hypothetical protein
MVVLHVTIAESEVIEVEVTENIIEVELLGASPQGPPGPGLDRGGSAGQ